MNNRLKPPLAKYCRTALLLAGVMAGGLYGQEPAGRPGSAKPPAAVLAQAIDADNKLAEDHYRRGREQFRLGNFKQSIADFDKYVSLSPQKEKTLWERGITYYYAGQYEKGARQFQLYQTYQGNDVENSVWCYLCMARTVGVQKAREKMLPIQQDRRVPMMEIYDLFRGKRPVEDVFQAAHAGKPPVRVLQQRLFHAHLYVGLYYESVQDEQQAKKHVFQAAGKYRIGHYMGHVARIHADLLRKRKQK